MLSLNKNKQFPASLHDALLIMSDLSPAGILALKTLRQYLPEVPILLVCGESLHDKTALGINIMMTYGFRNFHVIRGHISDKDYPLNEIKYPSASTMAITRAAPTVESFLAEYNCPLIIGLYSLCDLMNISNKILEKCVLLMYGSYLLRCMYFNQDMSLVLSFINNAFRHVILYESFYATGHENSYWLPEECSDTALIRATKWCNKLDLAEALSVIKEVESNNERLGRNAKIVSNIISSKYRHIVMADFCLILYAFNPILSGQAIRGHLSVNSEEYSEIAPSNRGRVYLVKDLERKELLNYLGEL